MNKIYIVRDDSRIFGVFDDKKKLDWFLNGYEDEWTADEYEANDTGGLQVLPVYELVLRPDSLELINYGLYSFPTHVGYYQYNGKSEHAMFVQVQADSLNKAIEKAKEHGHQ
jgi:hypothetical protein